MIRLESEEKEYRLYRAAGEQFPENTFIFCSEISRSILYNPQIAGRELQERMERASRIFVDIAGKKALCGRKFGDLVEFVLLSGGLYYCMARGFRETHGHALPQCFLGIKRERVEGGEGQFRAVSTYENFESLPKNPGVVIGDTIATGSTIIRAVGELEKAVEAVDGKLDSLAVCSLACSTEGARRLGSMEKKMRVRNPDFRLHLIVAEQLFHLMPDGTDLRFLREDSVMPDETKDYTLDAYGEALGKEMKCAIFDWGTRCKNPKAHYMEFIQFCDRALAEGKLDAKGRAEMGRMKGGAEAGLEEFEGIL